MFLGNGDTSRLEEREQKTLADLRRMVETGHIRALNPKEVDVAIRAITFYGRFESVIYLFNSMRNVLVLAGFGLTFWWATGGENFVTEWVRSAVGQ